MRAPDEHLPAPPAVVAPLITPLDGDDRVDARGVASLVDHVLACGAHGLFALGTTGEFAGLGDGERRRMVDAVVGAAGGRVPIWIGVGDTSTSRVLSQLEELPHDAIAAYVVCAPYYQGELTEAELERHFVAVADRAPRPVLLYNIPQTTRVVLAPPLLARLAAHPNVDGVKDSSGDMVRLQETLQRAEAERHGAFAVYQGQERLAAVSLLAGADGLVSGLANIVPDVLTELVAACRRGQLDAAIELQRRVTRLSDAIAADFWLRGIKLALAARGVAGRRLLAPWAPARDPDSEASLLRLIDETRQMSYAR